MSRPKDNFIVRNMSREELDMALKWAADEGWNPGLRDAIPFWAADPNGFFLGILDGQPIGCCAATIYGDGYAFFGLYMVRQGFRHQGYGMQMTQARLRYIGGRTAGLDGVVEMQRQYEKIGFQIAFRSVRFRGMINGQSSKRTVPTAAIAWQELESFDRRHFGAPRSSFLRSWVTQPDSHTLIVVDEDALQGYGTIRACQQGFKIGPLFATTEKDAEELFQSLCHSVGGGEIFLDAPMVNGAAVRLAERHGMEQVFETARMYRNGQPEVPMSQIYGITTFELG